jgi:hypothetical protein
MEDLFFDVVLMQDASGDALLGRQQRRTRAGQFFENGPNNPFATIGPTSG